MPVEVDLLAVVVMLAGLGMALCGMPAGIPVFCGGLFVLIVANN